jgi:methyl-accepting chemotaxis protein
MSKLRNGTRLYLGFGAIVAVLVILVVMAYANFSRLAQANAMNVQRVSAVISEITGASEQQREGIDQVNVAITQIDHVTQQNAALVEQAAAAAKTMQEQAAELSNAVAVFRIDDAPRVARAQPAQARPVSAPRHPARAPARVTAATPARQVVNSESWEEF